MGRGVEVSSTVTPHTHRRYASCSKHLASYFVRDDKPVHYIKAAELISKIIGVHF